MPKRYFLYLLLIGGALWGSWKWESRKEEKTESPKTVKVGPSPKFTLLDKEVNQFLNETRGLYNSKSFEALEQLARTIRAEKQTFSDGSWKIVRYYRSFNCRLSEPDSMWRLHDEIHQKWIVAKPASQSAKTAYADFLVDYAFFARQFVVGNTMSPEVAELFRSRLALAHRMLDEVEKAGNKDPGWWMVAVRLGQAQVWSTVAMNAMLESGHRAEPTFWELDQEHAAILTSEQYGKPGAWEEFANEVFTRPNGLGAEGYARLVAGMTGLYRNVFRQSKASWDLTRRGLEVILKSAPDSRHHICTAANLAGMAGDHRYAGELLGRLGVAYLLKSSVVEEVEGFSQTIAQAFENRQFRSLDEIASGLRKSKELFRDGSWKIARFYEALEFRGDRQPDEKWMARVQMYKDWSSANPQSVTARVAYADFLTKYAWHARGSGYRDTVSDEGWRLFRERLDAARRALEGTKTIAEKDPFAWSVGLTIALGQEWKKEDYDSFLEAGRRFEPTFWYYDQKRAYSLLPRWYGKKGDWEAFLEDASARPSGLGNELYARVVMHLSHRFGEDMQASRASWEKTRDGLRILTKKYPEATELLSGAVALSVEAGDREFAKELFGQLGKRYSPEAWDSPERFVESYQWANAQL